MNAELLFSLFVGGCVALTGSLIFLRSGQFSSWWRALLFWFAIAPILLSHIHSALRQAVATGEVSPRTWLLVLAPCMLSLLLLGLRLLSRKALGK